MTKASTVCQNASLCLPKDLKYVVVSCASNVNTNALYSDHCAVTMTLFNPVLLTNVERCSVAADTRTKPTDSDCRSIYRQAAVICIHDRACLDHLTK